MYIPNEGVYYEIVQQDGEREDLIAYAWSRRIITTSPNSLYAYIQVISIGLRGLQVEQNAKSMLESLSSLEGDFERFAEYFRLVGTHLSRAKAKYDDGLPRLDSIQRGLPGRRDPVSPVDALEDGGSRPGRGRPTDHAPD
jgi:DNA recombination protein RmuC